MAETLYSGTTLEEFVPKIDVVDNLVSTDKDKPLSANQGKVLNEKFVGLSEDLLDINVIDISDAIKKNFKNINQLDIEQYIVSEKTNVITFNGNILIVPKNYPENADFDNRFLDDDIKAVWYVNGEYYTAKLGRDFLFYLTPLNLDRVVEIKTEELTLNNFIGINTIEDRKLFETLHNYNIEDKDITLHIYLYNDMDIYYVSKIIFRLCYWDNIKGYFIGIYNGNVVKLEVDVPYGMTPGYPVQFIASIV